MRIYLSTATMQWFLTSIFLFSFHFSQAAEFTVFEEDGFFGIKDNTGQITVPAVYEKLGWSDGTVEVHNGVIGFQKERLWGLITVKNKPLTSQKFYNISPFSKGYFKASIKGSFSNKLFYGLLDDQGKVVVSFSYFSLKRLGENLLVSIYENSEKFGLLNTDNQIILPISYRSIRLLNGFYIATLNSYTIDLFKVNGELVQNDLDSLVYDNGWKIFKDGTAGFVEKNGALKYPFEYKNFEIENGIVFPISFDNWSVYQGKDLIVNSRGDSIERSNLGFWIIYRNGVQHFGLMDSIQIDPTYKLKGTYKDYLIVKNSKNLNWNLANPNGSISSQSYDSIVSLGIVLWGLLESRWFMIDEKGAKIRKIGYEYILPGIGNQFIAKFNDYWGLLDERGDILTNFKYDSIVPLGKVYTFQYLNKYGTLNTNGYWEVSPEFQEILAFDNATVGRIGQAYYYFTGGVQRLVSTSEPISDLGQFLIVRDESNKLGLVDKKGSYFVMPKYDEICQNGELYVLRAGEYVELTSVESQILFHRDEIIEVGRITENLIPIKKDGKWGFVDLKGRLRISNRYDEVNPYSEGLAAFKLRGKWGFIDKNDKIVIQPHYDNVSDFKNELCIVTINGKKGLINKEGQEKLEISMNQLIKLDSDKFLVKKNEKAGLVDKKGDFVLHPNFDRLWDYENTILVVNNGKYGILDKNGKQLRKIEHKEIKISGEYTIVKY